MRALPLALQSALDSGATTLCHGWRVTRRDGRVQGFTDHDRDLVLAGVTFRAGTIVAGSENALAQGLGVTGMEFGGALCDAALTEDDLAAGYYDGAAVDLFLIDWSDPAVSLLLRRGTIGEVRRADGAFAAELRSLSDALNQSRGRVFAGGCDADLGDARCGIDLAAPAHRATAAVVAVEGPLRLLAAGLDGFAPGTFSEGRISFTSGADAGFSVEVKSHAAGPSGAVLQLWQRPPSPLAPGDAFTVTAGCDKRFSTCRDRFANTANFRGFPHMPGNDLVLAIAVPGEGGHDGAVPS
ncbi:DUF2163 domain-containing protein [Aquabacter spiritensis]|uniref:Putative phage protein (TIGR02218 family) n=1 Tax=Aquabacter spiritensis TaxID=933073 RepID=A0A4R3M7M3_9HYPH|nr:DUF2163 domain-containing protein [Aquabacter spiritensis]TCT07617.1 putative phage protein (TIGR02218 family) [Aquabacter spiritensis]